MELVSQSVSQSVSASVTKIKVKLSLSVSINKEFLDQFRYYQLHKKDSIEVNQSIFSLHTHKKVKSIFSVRKSINCNYFFLYLPLTENPSKSRVTNLAVPLLDLLGKRFINKLRGNTCY